MRYFLRCTNPPMTKKVFAPGFREWAGRARIESKYEVKDIHASGDVAYLWSHISIVMTSKRSLAAAPNVKVTCFASFASRPLANGFLPRRKLIPRASRSKREENPRLYTGISLCAPV